MAEARRDIVDTSARHRCAGSRRPCLYDLAIRAAIAAQHGLDGARTMSLCWCEACGEPYLLQESWQPHSEDGELACPRCGAIVEAWSSGRSFVAYWLKSGSTLRMR
jgi:hypothetical protein